MELQNSGCRLIAIEQTDDAVEIRNVKELTSDCVVILGNEVKGISQEVVDLCDEVWHIAQSGQKQSMNVSVCAGIILSHIRNVSR